jgi:hypothetical protein
LIKILGPIDSDACLMDANLDDAHELAYDIGSIVKLELSGPSDLMDPSTCQENYDAFESVRLDEHDMHEVYAGSLERYWKRRRRDLSVAELDSDMMALVKRRRAYISTLQTFQERASAILSAVRNEPSRPEC